MNRQDKAAAQMLETYVTNVRALQAMHDLIVWMFCNVCREFDDVLTLQEWGVGKVEW